MQGADRRENVLRRRRCRSFGIFAGSPHFQRYWTRRINWAPVSRCTLSVFELKTEVEPDEFRERPFIPTTPWLVEPSGATRSEERRVGRDWSSDVCAPDLPDVRCQCSNSRRKSNLMSSGKGPLSPPLPGWSNRAEPRDRKSTRLNSSH